jgi:aldehyde:ferredoxin oxidoreductase
MHEPRFKRGLAIGYAVSPTGADHCHSLHDSGLVYPNEDGFAQNGGLRQMGVLEAIDLEELGPAKVRATLYNSISSIVSNCATICSFTGWSKPDLAAMIQAATGFDVGVYELIKVGERALTLARVFNMREGLTAADDTLCERSFGPTVGGALAEGGIDRDELARAMQLWYGMAGWDENGVPTPGKLYELDVPWAIEHLPA